MRRVSLWEVVFAASVCYCIDKEKCNRSDIEEQLPVIETKGFIQLSFTRGSIFCFVDRIQSSRDSRIEGISPVCSVRYDRYAFKRRRNLYECVNLLRYM